MNALNQTNSAQYDYNILKPTSTTDANNQQTSYTYNDALERLTQVHYPHGGNRYYYYENPTWTIERQDKDAPGDMAIETQSVYDGLGRLVETRQLEGEGHLIAVDTGYDALGRVSVVTNPSRILIADWSNDGLGYRTDYSYDPLGRTTQVHTEADGANATTSYSGVYQTVTDQAGKAKQYKYDSLQRVITAVKDPGRAELHHNLSLRHAG